LGVAHSWPVREALSIMASHHVLGCISCFFGSEPLIRRHASHPMSQDP
jgi:hypothetical protein